MVIFKKLFLLVFFSFTLNVFGYQVKDAPLLKTRPAWLSVCRRNDPEANKCINDLFLKMFPYLAVGIPEINVDHFEPLTLDRVSVSKGSGAITLAGSLFNLNIMGASNSTPSNTNFDQHKKHWNFELDLPLLDIKSQYNLKGNILVLPLVGHGACDLKLFNTHTFVKTNITFQNRDGEEIVYIDSMQVRFLVGGLKIKLYNLFNGNKILGSTVNAFINQNALEIVGELEDSIGSSLAAIFKELMNNIFVKIPTRLWYMTDEQYEEYVKEEKQKQVQSDKTVVNGN